ncbi:hypothetical protein ABZ319_12340 [Nocardia sp. NPDC005978]|uniref:hypothetical protein n=1 Tax=Nocardia sp. NPDC005978 TaxID=3156725 RepID=UPI0033B1AB2E
MDQLLAGLLERMNIEDFVDVFETLVWKLEDNGEEMFTVLSEWLEGDDRLKIEAALNSNGGFIFSTNLEMSTAFEKLVHRYPEFRELTMDILRRWDLRVQE